MWHTSKHLMLGMLATALIVPAISVGVTGASAAEGDRYRSEKRYERYNRYDRYEGRNERRYAQDRRRDYRNRNNSYSARANDLDPAGDYKGYPDWARVALSPKYDNRN